MGAECTKEEAIADVMKMVAHSRSVTASDAPESVKEYHECYANFLEGTLPIILQECERLKEIILLGLYYNLIKALGAYHRNLPFEERKKKAIDNMDYVIAKMRGEILSRFVAEHVFLLEQAKVVMEQSQDEALFS
jgi:hypothetical protein